MLQAAVVMDGVTGQAKSEVGTEHKKKSSGKHSERSRPRSVLPRVIVTL
jgi:hypothetical protein